MQAVVKRRELLITNIKIFEKLEKIETHLADHDEQFRIVSDAIKQLLTTEEKPRKKIGF